MNGSVIYEIKDSVALVTIKRPEALNALNPDVIENRHRVMDMLNSNSLVKVVIITGSGDKAFVAGVDITSIYNMTPEEAQSFAREGHRLMNYIASMRPVTIAAINGLALGGGCELAIACDIRVASTKASLGMPEVTIGVIPGFGGTQRLPRLVGLGKAKELLITGRQCKAEEAKEIGLVNHVTSPSGLIGTCMEMAKTIIKNSSCAIDAGKLCMTLGVEMDITSALELEIALFSLAFATSDQKTGMTAFIEKRHAEFR